MADCRPGSPHLAGIAPYVPIYPVWDVPNTNGIPQSWSAVIMGCISDRSHNTEFVDSNYRPQKMLEQYAHYRPFAPAQRFPSFREAEVCWKRTHSHFRCLSYQFKLETANLIAEKYDATVRPAPGRPGTGRLVLFTACDRKTDIRVF